jgi:dipeptidyl aminopeptidase/acylaminoacyl peptidase
MRAAGIIAFSIAALLAGRPRASQEPETPLSIPHILRLPVLSDFELSPDGVTVALTGTVFGDQNVWLIRKPDELGERLAPGKGRDREPSWSPDGKNIVFVSDRGGSPHLYIAEPGAPEPRPVTSHQGEDRTPRWSPDGERIAFLSRRLGSETGWDVWVVPARGGTPQPLSKDPLDEEDPRWSPDGKRLAFTFRGGRHVDRRIGVASVEGTESRPLLPEGWDGDCHSPRWSPDGKRLAFVSDHGGRKALFLVSAEGGEPEPVTKSEHEETDPAWRADGSAIAHVSNQDGNLHLAVTSLETRTTRRITRGAGVHREPRWAPDGRSLVAFYEGPTRPRDVWSFEVEKGGRRRLTESLMTELDVRQMARPESLRYPSTDGRPITGFLYLPPEATAERPAPLVVHPHGGPTSQWQNGWHPFEQYLVQKGFAIFAPNVRGSSGFGLEFENLNDRDWGRGDLEDLVAGVRHLTARQEIRRDRVGIWGVSYGGFLTLAAIGRHAELFQCAIEAVGMPDLEQLYRETNLEGRTYLDRELGPLRGNLQLYRDLSPVGLVKHVKTPLLSFHGEIYPLVPYSTKRGFLEALKRRRHALAELLLEGDGARGTYRFELFPDAARLYMEKVEEFLSIYL